MPAWHKRGDGGPGIAANLVIAAMIAAGFARYGGRGERVIARYHDCANAHRPKPVEALLHAALYDVLQVDRSQHARATAITLGDHQRRSSLARDTLDDGLDLARDSAPILLNPLRDRVARTLPELDAVHIHAAHPRGGGEWNQLHCAV